MRNQFGLEGMLRFDLFSIKQLKRDQRFIQYCIRDILSDIWYSILNSKVWFTCFRRGQKAKNDLRIIQNNLLEKNIVILNLKHPQLIFDVHFYL